MVSTAMDIQDEVGNTCLEPVCVPNNQMPVSAEASQMSGVQINEAGFSGNEHAPKIRKPYTITKQRERWTEEEHKKFIEALTLYGRAWRKIEEHIGTKTAVQIRSHAQKFFSKVVRDSANNSTGDLKPIEIPPPRPKRKPLHPYPRKFANMSSNGSPVLKQLERTLQVPSAYGLENRSPTSVLSAVGSDTLGSMFSNQPNTCSSPVPSAAGSNEQDNGGQSQATSVEGENRSPSPGPTIAGPNDDNRPSMVFDENDTLGEGSSREAQAHTFKLFGKTVLVNDSQKPSTSSVGNTVQHLKLSPTTDMESQHLKLSPTTHINVAKLAEQPAQRLPHEIFPGAPVRNAWTPWPGGLPPWFYCMSLPRDNSSDQRTVVQSPWWPFCGNLPFPFTHPLDPGTNELPPKTRTMASGEKAMQMDVSWTGSSTSSASEAGIENQNIDVAEKEHSMEDDSAPASGLKLSDTSAFSSWKAGSNKQHSGGFVPYKRCAAESEVQHLQTSNEVDSEGQAIQLCL